jgi:putative ABC transport system ATP-binding protein
VAIARALINNPSIILADEPTGNLDSKTSHEIMEILGKIHNEGNTVVLVTHEEDISSFAHRVIRLKDGMIETDKINGSFDVLNPFLSQDEKTLFFTNKADGKLYKLEL